MITTLMNGGGFEVSSSFRIGTTKDRVLPLPVIAYTYKSLFFLKRGMTDC